VVALRNRLVAAFTMENLIIALIALGCLGYLLVAVWRPEKF
jgi:K+-transporting ATPase KdpF subunit